MINIANHSLTKCNLTIEAFTQKDGELPLLYVFKRRLQSSLIDDPICIQH